MSGALRVRVRGIGLLGPGLADWTSGAAALRAPASAWQAQPTVLPAPARLPPAERRRAGTVVKLAMGVADQACAQSGADPQALATVFAASSGDASNCHEICIALATPERLVSPTRFTNSVHNAAAGYWHIATASRAPSTSLSAYDASFAAGLLEAAAQAVTIRAPVLLVAGDAPYPEPLQGVRPLPDAFGVALVLDAADASGTALAMLELALREDAPPSVCDHPGLEALRGAIPAARSLPLLQALARNQPAELAIDYLPGLALGVRLIP